MIYVLVEDAKDGKKLCDEIVNHYFYEFKHSIDVKSYNGITNLPTELEILFKSISEVDRVIVVYDDIIENPIVADAMREVEIYTSKQNVYMLPTNSFELETILIDDIEFTANIEEYETYIKKIKSDYVNFKDIRYLTRMTKNNTTYDTMYSQIRKDKSTRRIYQKLSEKQFENAITIESLSKKLISKLYTNCVITKPMGLCWVTDCCHKINSSKCSPFLNREKMLGNKYTLLKVMVSNTSYKNLIKVLSKLLEIEVKEQPLKIEEFLDNEVIHSCYINKCFMEGKYDTLL